MARKIVQSFAALELRLPALRIGGKQYPEVTLPKAKYSAMERERGKSPYLILEGAALQRVEMDENVMNGFEPRGVKGFVAYRWVDHIPDTEKSTGDRMADLQREVNKLREENRQLKQQNEELRAEITKKAV